MSWIVESLLNDREKIRAVSDIESDEFNDLLVVEKAVKTLKEQGKLNSMELAIIAVETPEEPIALEKPTLSKRKSQICDRIAFYLGGYFTEEGYLNYIKKKHGLSDDQTDALRKFMKSEYRHKIMRKPINQ
jgi:hypothetical protein